MKEGGVLERAGLDQRLSNENNCSSRATNTIVIVVILLVV